MFEIFDELLLCLSTRSSIILSGNTQDLFPDQSKDKNGNSRILVPLTKALCSFYHKNGYSVAVYDNASGAYLLPYNDAAFAMFRQETERIGSLEGKARDDAIIAVVRKLMNSDAVPVVLIIRNAGVQTVGENVFVRLRDILLEAGYVPASGRRLLRNQMVLVVDDDIKDEIIPVLFQKESRMIHIGKADSNERRSVLDDYYKVFDATGISAAEKKRFYGEILQKTDGMSIRELLMVPRTAKAMFPGNSQLSLNHCLSAIRQVRYGRIRDPWTDRSVLEKIYTGKLEEDLNKKVKGEKELIRMCIDQLKESTCPYMRIDPDYGNGVKLCLMVSGPTGVGKTAFARSLCEAIYGSRDALIQIDGGSLQDAQGANVLLGSAKGYIGSDEPGLLRSILKEHPDGNVLLLIDELDKCHKSVYKALLSLLDTGEITDMSGERLDFRNCILIFTSNVGIRKAAKRDTFTDDQYLCDPDTPIADVKKAVEEGMRDTFSPEFLGRLADHTCTLPFMSQTTAEELIQERMFSWIQRAKSLFGIYLEFDRSVVQKAIHYCAVDRSKGGRLINRRLRTNILSPIALAMMKQKLHEGDRIIVTDVDPAGRKALVSKR